MTASRLVPPRIRAIEVPPFDPLHQRAAELRSQGHHVISLGQALPFFAPPASAVAAARAALDAPEVNIYSTDPGRRSLRTVLASRLGETLGATLTADDFVITAGGNQAFTLALTTLIDPGDEVVLLSPYFTNHHMAVTARGAVPVEAPVADRVTFGARWSDIEPRLSSRTKAVVLCNPSNPTGGVVDGLEGARIARELQQRGILLICDEAYMQFVYEGAHWSAASTPGWRDHVVLIGTFSKAFGMMGWRLGYMLADAAVCAQAVKIQDAMIICAPVISQFAVERAVCDDWSYPLQFHDDFRARRRTVLEGLAGIPRLSWTPTPGGLFAFACVDGCDDSHALAVDLLERAHVVSMPGAAFGSGCEGYLRLSYGFASSDDLTEAMRRLGRYFAAA